jgi:endonuclease/exonuclease/phosphatase family metal-dependent hydrolase
VTGESPALQELCSEEWGFSQPGPGIDHILVRGAAVTPIRRWPDERRERDGRLLSDHAPVELDIG